MLLEPSPSCECWGRWNSPYINHFISADTAIASYTNPQDLNRYSYVKNNPLRYTDPTGHRACGDGEDVDCNGHKQDPKKNPHAPKPKHHKSDKRENDGSGKPLFSPLSQGSIPPDWLQALDGVKVLWRSGPEWLFLESGRRLIAFDHPHVGAPFWHINTDLRILPHVVNIEPMVRVVAPAVSAAQAVASFVGSTETFIPAIMPNPDLLPSPFRLPQLSS